MGVDNILQQIDNEIRSLPQARSLLVGVTGSSGSIATGKRIVSAASRRKMAAAQKARWAKYAAKKVTAPSAGKRVISIALEREWLLRRRQGGPRLRRPRRLPSRVFNNGTESMVCDDAPFCAVSIGTRRKTIA